MANSKLLKEAIADAKAVRETAIANAKIALEEAFTPRLQSILSQKLQAEMEGEEEEVELEEEYGADDVSAADSSEIGAGEGDTESGTDNAQPEDGAVQSATDAHTDLDPETESETAEPGKEDENMPIAEGDDEEVEEMYEEEGEEEVNEEDEDELDLESIIRELESELEEGDDEEVYEEEEEVEEDVDDPMIGHEAGTDPLAYNEEEEEEVHTEEEHEAEMSEEEDMDDEEEIDLEEILREMGYGDDEEVSEEEEEDHSAQMAEMEDELEEAYKTIRSLKSTINEVNLLNAKLLYTNKLFRSYDLTNEQKMKVVETLDRTGNVREVKLVYSTLAESFKYTGSVSRKPKTKITESFASKAVRSTAPRKEIISENTNALADRFKKLANIK